jgi:hypothetical protein
MSADRDEATSARYTRPLLNATRVVIAGGWVAVAAFFLLEGGSQNAVLMLAGLIVIIGWIGIVAFFWRRGR